MNASRRDGDHCGRSHADGIGGILETSRSHIASESASFPDETLPDAACPACGGIGLRLFYSADSVPRHSCLLMRSRDQALQYPRGDLRLAFCPTCGFVTNVAFDPSHSEYSEDYEGSQATSPTFSAFARSLATDLIEQHNLHGKTVVEIGCGDGEFLRQLCELGDCRGIGFDPAHRAVRPPDGAAPGVEFVCEVYDHRFANLAADLIICRHTLEHIAPISKFLSDLRRTIGVRTDTAVFFEVPDITRQLNEGAFWDLFYEHCSYFSPGSLARVFRAAGFDVMDIDLEYEGQYITITARPSTGNTSPPVDRAEDSATLWSRIDSFSTTCGRALDTWRGFIRSRHAVGKRLAIWGSGSKAVGFLSTLGMTEEVGCVIDINPAKHGAYMPGLPQQIMPPVYLREYRPDCVIVMNPIYLDEIRGDLADLGLTPELTAV